VSEALEMEQQLWLLDLLQLMLWRRQPSEPVQRRLEQLRRQLLGHGQPRLAWEVTLLRLAGQGQGSG
jgi:DNA polymerase-3 subunit delta'